MELEAALSPVWKRAPKGRGQYLPRSWYFCGLRKISNTILEHHLSLQILINTYDVKCGLIFSCPGPLIQYSVSKRKRWGERRGKGKGTRKEVGEGGKEGRREENRNKDGRGGRMEDERPAHPSTWLTTWFQRREASSFSSIKVTTFLNPKGKTAFRSHSANSDWWQQTRSVLIPETTFTQKQPLVQQDYTWSSLACRPWWLKGLA